MRQRVQLALKIRNAILTHPRYKSTTSKNQQFIKGNRRELLEGLQAFAISASLTFVFLQKVAYITMVSGPSMLPTFNVALDFVLVSRLFWKPPQLGDLLVYTSPESPDRIVVKRVLGLPGDSVIDKDEQVIVPEGHLWMEGDNPPLSNDSRLYGPVSMGLVHGKVVFQLFPPRFLPNPFTPV